MTTDKPVRKGAYGDQMDERIIGLLAERPNGATLREILEHLGWAYVDSTRERATHRLKRMIERGAISDSYVGKGGERGRTCKSYTYVRPLHAVDAPPPEPTAKAKPKPPKAVPLKRLPDHIAQAVEAARSRFDPVEPLDDQTFRLGAFTVSEGELFAILDREPGVLSRVADRFLGEGAGA